MIHRVVQHASSRLLAVLAALASAAATNAPPEIMLQTGHNRDVNSVAWSRDGEFIATAGTDNTIRLWGATHGDLLRVITGHRAAVLSVRFSPDSRRLVSGGQDQTMRVWDAASGRELQAFTNFTHPVTSVAFGPDGQFVATAASSGFTRLWHLATGDSTNLHIHARPATAVAFSPDGREVASGSVGNMAKLLTVANPRVRIELPHANTVTGVAYSKDGSTLATSCQDRIARLWNPQTGELCAQFVHSQPGEAVAISGSGRWLAVAEGFRILVWDVQRKTLRATLEGHNWAVRSLDFSPDEGRIVSGSGDGSARVWDVAQGRPLFTLHTAAQDSMVTAVAVSPDGRIEAAATHDGRVIVWDSAKGAVLHSLGGHPSQVWGLAFSPDGQLLASSGLDDIITLWRLDTGTTLRKLAGHRDWVISVAFSPDSTKLVSAAGRWAGPVRDKRALLWDVRTGGVLREFDGHAGRLIATAYHPRLPLVATGSDDGTAKIWNADDGSCVATLKGGGMEELAFSPDGARLAAGLSQGRVLVWKTTNWSQQLDLSAHEGVVHSVAFSPDNRLLASVAADSRIRIWDSESGALLRECGPRGDEVLSVAFHPKRRMLIAGGYDMGGRHFDTGTGALIERFVTFFGNDWLAFEPATGRYHSSENGDAYARLRFHNSLREVYPLHFYRAELRRTNGLADAAPVTALLRPKPLRLWRSRTDLHRTAGYVAFIMLGGVCFFYAWRAFASRRGQRAQEDFSRQLMQAQETDRQRIAAELHDSLGQNLTIIKNRARMAIRDGAGSAAEQLEEISRVASQTIDEVRTISHNLRPHQLDRLGLTQAVRAAARQLAETGGLGVETHIEDIDHALPPADEIHFYRVVQECLSNVARHSMAATARLSITRDNGTVLFGLEDDGRGFNPRAPRPEQGRGGNGLAGIRQRVKMMGGTFRCDSAPGQGTRLRVAIPVAASRAARSTPSLHSDNAAGSNT